MCNKCEGATYCNASCKKKHRAKHKEACERRIAELHEEELERERRAAEFHDEKLFKKPPPNEDCPICMLPLPFLHFGLGGRERAPSFFVYFIWECCEQATSYKCVYINADNVTGPLIPNGDGGYLIEGGVGSKKGTMTMSLAGPGSSLVETAPGVATPQVSRTYFW